MINENMPHVQVKHTFDQWVGLGISVQWYGEGCRREVAKNMDFILLTTSKGFEISTFVHRVAFDHESEHSVASTNMNVHPNATPVFAVASTTKFLSRCW